MKNSYIFPCTENRHIYAQLIYNDPLREAVEVISNTYVQYVFLQHAFMNFSVKSIL